MVLVLLRKCVPFVKAIASRGADLSSNIVSRRLLNFVHFECSTGFQWADCTLSGISVWVGEAALNCC